MTLFARRFPAKLGLLSEITAFVKACAEEFDPTLMSRVALVLEEAFVNICNYAYPESGGNIEIRCGRDETFFTIEIFDWGMPFDPLTLSEPDIELDVAERGIGGLGVHFIRSFSDAVSYRRENGCNILHADFRMNHAGGVNAGNRS